MASLPWSEEELQAIYQEFRNLLQQTRHEIGLQGRKTLGVDIGDPRITGDGAPDPDAFMIRANQIGLAIFDEGFYALAEQYYEELQHYTEEYRDGKGWRHAGALMANRGVACWAQGNVEHAVKLWVDTAQREDSRTYQVDLLDSPAVNALYERYVRKEAREFAELAAQSVEPSVTEDEVVLLCERLRTSRDGQLEFALMDCLTTALRNTGERMPGNVFSAWRCLTALRNLACLMEWQLKTIAKVPDAKLYQALVEVFKQEHWWGKCQSALNEAGADEKGGVPVERLIVKAIEGGFNGASAPPAQSVLVAWGIRNHTVHWMDTAGELVTEYSMQALGHVLNVMIAAAKLEAVNRLAVAKGDARA